MKQAVLVHYYSGHLFFTAAALFLLVVLLDVTGVSRGNAAGRRITGFVALLALALGAMGAPPMPLYLWVPVAIATAACVVAGFGEKRRPFTGIAAAVAVIVAVALEVPYHVDPTGIRRPKHLMVMGDSLSSGGFGEKTIWHQRMGDMAVTNLALPSDGVREALEHQAPMLLPPGNEQVVLIEIGGNDMLEGTPPDAFAKALDGLARAARRNGRKVVMLELPLLPGAWRYGLAQRQVARRHGVALIPKRLLAAVLLDPLDTSDGLHLTDRGHAALANGIRASLGW
ncbi:MAG TPA: GDSL-type esterase/lipase family protein [Thermoanaerobaculia bacterium]|nr:GDSL-type esterase/lipase family protein [Thermoanaerobaculia bacterium]